MNSYHYIREIYKGEKVNIKFDTDKFCSVKNIFVSLSSSFLQESNPAF